MHPYTVYCECDGMGNTFVTKTMEMIWLDMVSIVVVVVVRF